MAQNITFLGASYSNVPAVELPKTGGGTASFTDVSDTTAVAAQVAEGAYFYTAAGVKTEGTATGGSMVIRDEPDSHGGTIRHITAGSIIQGTIEITENGTYDVASYADAEVSVTPTAGSATTPATTITANPSISVSSGGLITATASATKSVTPTVVAGYVSSGTAGTITVSGSNTSQLSTQAGATITPTESEQTAVASGKYTTGAVKVGAISSTYVGSGITQRSSSDLTASGATVTVPAGYYENQASKSVASGTAGTPTASKGTVSNHAISVTPSVTNTAGYISGGTKTGTAVSVSASELVSGTYTVSASGTADVTNYASISVPAQTLPTSASSTSSGASKATISRSTSDQYINIPTGYNSAAAYYKVSAVANGTEGTPTATKGTVSNHAISVTPSVTNTAGYISGGTKTGTAVTVTASELASGNKEITDNGTNIDVVGYSTVSVDVATSNVYTAELTGSGNENYCYVQLNHTGRKYYAPTSIDHSFTFVDGDELYIYVQAGTAREGHIIIDGIEVARSTDVANGSADYTFGLPRDAVLVQFTYSCYIYVWTRQNTVTISGQGDSSNCYIRFGSSATYHYEDGEVLSFNDMGSHTLACYARDPSGIATISVNGIVAASASSSGGPCNYVATFPISDVTVEMTYGATVNMNIVTTCKTISLNGMQAVDGYAYANILGMSEEQLALYIARSLNFNHIQWPSGLTSIGKYAFAGCTNFNPSSLPNGITSIGQYAFYQCTNLALTSLPSSITSIGQYAFYSCTNLALTSLPSSMTSIENYAFYQCTGLALTSLPSGVTSIGNYAFYSCTNLALTSLPSSLTTINQYAFYNCRGLTLTSLPSSVTSIGNYAFYGCTGITSISCSGAITTFSTNAFTGGSSSLQMALTSASFPNLATTSNLGTVFGNITATYACKSLAFCDIGKATGIASSSFANCYSLTKLVIRKTSVCTLANTSAFTNTPMSGYNGLTGTVYVPSSLISSYRTATNWKTLYDAGTVTFSAIEGSPYEL